MIGRGHGRWSPAPGGCGRPAFLAAAVVLLLVAQNAAAGEAGGAASPPGEEATPAGEAPSPPVKSSGPDSETDASPGATTTKVAPQVWDDGSAASAPVKAPTDDKTTPPDAADASEAGSKRGSATDAAVEPGARSPRTHFVHSTGDDADEHRAPPEPHTADAPPHDTEDATTSIHPAADASAASSRPAEKHTFGGARAIAMVGASATPSLSFGVAVGPGIVIAVGGQFSLNTAIQPTPNEPTASAFGATLLFELEYLALNTTYVAMGPSLQAGSAVAPGTPFSTFFVAPGLTFWVTPVQGAPVAIGSGIDAALNFSSTGALTVALAWPGVRFAFFFN